ncbi:MAG: S8 family peptidase [Anaerocolumna sp.]
MNEEERFKIISNDYMDLIADELTLQNIYSLISDVSLEKINNIYSIAYLPVSYINQNIIYEVGYNAIPKVYGLLSTNSYEVSGEMHACQNSMNQLSGSGVLIGIVDTGIDYRNRVFQYADGTSKIISIWDQTIDNGNNYPEGFYFGMEYTRERINTALNSEDPFSVVPSTDEIGHGTVLAGIAGGTYDTSNNFRGIAPNAEFVIVKLKQAKANIKDFFYLPQDTICYQENDIMLGINYLIQTANQLKRPIAICIGLGSSQGAHLGEGILNNYLSGIGQLSNVSIVVAAGNEGSSGHHIFGETSPANNYNDVLLTVGNDNPGFFMEFWGNAPSVFTVDIYTPGFELIGRIPSVFIQGSTIHLVSENTSIIVDNILESSLGGDQFMLYRIRYPISGTWRFRITALGNLSASYHMWLPINNFIKEGTYFENSNPYTTITTPGNEKTVLTATAYNALTGELYYAAGKGFTKNNQPKPDITAPGVDILAPGIGNQYMFNTGTSVAAAYTAGTVALLLEWGIIRGNQITLPSAKVRGIITIGADRSEDIIYPNPDWGFGIINLTNSIVLTIRF